MGLLAFSSLFALFVNAIRMVALAKESIRYTGGTISHIGLALLFLGIIGSGRYGEKQTASLPIDVPTEVLGHRLTYTGSKQMQDGKWTFAVKVAGAGAEFTLEPVMYQSDYNNSLMRNPDYAASLTRDFYIEPVSLEEVTSPSGGPGAGSTLQLKKGETQHVGDAVVTFLRFDTSHKGAEASMAAGSFPVGAVLQVKRGAKSEEVIPVTIYRGTEKPEMRKVTTKDGVLGFELIAMNVGTKAMPSTIELSISGASVPAAPVVRSQLLVIEASVKPFMSVLWAGAVFVLFGLIISLTSKLNGSRQRQS
jgi:cytochrome c-type biogenesis protein CcmF